MKSTAKLLLRWFYDLFFPPPRGDRRRHRHGRSLPSSERKIMTMNDLFSYPSAPGFTEPTTSRDAAKATAGRAPRLRERVFEAVQHAGPDGLTADQAACALAENVLSVRPRVAELAAAGRLVRTGERRANESRLKAAVWRTA